MHIAKLSLLPTVHLSPNRNESCRDGADGGSDGMPDDVEQNFAFCPVENLDQIPDALLPNVERVLSS